MDTINAFLAEYGPAIRVCVFIGCFSILSAIELISHLRPFSQGKTMRRINNLTLLVLGALLVYFLFPLAALAIAQAVEQNNWGLLNFYELDYWARVIIAYILLDLSMYFQHVMFHTLPLFWRFHRVHHSDLDCDVTTGLRFHPIEILLSMLVKFMTIAALGAPILAVFLFEVSLNFMSMFTHANIHLPRSLERALTYFIITPRMHFIHHSSEESCTNSNFGFNISLWDRLFGTANKLSDEQLQNMEIGLGRYRNLKQQSIRWLLYLPFVTGVQNYAINRRNNNVNQ